ncbi:flagellar hook-length control protein FliK [bacterium]|nr:flagellar hook-length control protein FliK [bacterium]
MSIDDSYRHVEKPKAKPSEVDNQRAHDEKVPKTEKSDFDKVFEKVKQAQDIKDPAKPKAQAMTERSVEDVDRYRDKKDDGKKDDKDKKEGDKKESDERKGTDTTTARAVHGKGAKKGQSGYGGSGHQAFSGGHRASIEKIKSLAKSKTQKDGIGNKFAKELKSLMKDKEIRAPKLLNQDLLNQIVRHVKVGINLKGEKEMRMDLHGKVFQGLRLRVAEKDGKIRVHFLTATKGVKALFEKESEKIKQALIDKNIDVTEIIVS